MLKLIFTQPQFSQQSLELPDGAFSVGRSRRNQIIIEDASVSKEHAELLVYGKELIVRERGSQNGVFVGGVRVRAQSGVKHGEKIRFGRVELLLDLGAPEFEETTDITAAAYHVKMLQQAKGAAQAPVQFPMRFIPEGPADQATPTVASPCEPNAFPALPHEAQSRRTVHPSGPLTVWVWLISGVGVLFLGMYWLLKR